jgi:hypothetical protein
MRKTAHTGTALAALGIIALTALAPGTAQASCSNGLNSSSSYGTRCNTGREGSGQYRGAPNYSLGTVRGRPRRESGSLDYNLGKAKRPRRWHRPHNFGRGSFKPR